MEYYKSAEDYYKEMASTLQDVDTSEHSLIYNANMPVSMELSYGSMLMDEIGKQITAKSALDNGYYDRLVNICEDAGIDRKQATYATTIVTITGNKDTVIPKSFTVSTKGGLNYYTTIETKIGDNGTVDVLVQAEKEGSAYNVGVGEISSYPISYVGITSVTNKQEVVDGYDIESYESLYNRYYLKTRTPAISGNRFHYEQWALETVGTGSAKCIPGKGIVKVIITNSNKRKADEKLIQEVYDHIDQQRPLLAGTLEVISVTEKAIKVTANIEIDNSVSISDITDTFKLLLKDYFDDEVYKSKKIRVTKIGSLLEGIDGVVDYSDLKINDATSNITLTDEEIAVVGEVELGDING